MYFQSRANEVKGEDYSTSPPPHHRRGNSNQHLYTEYDAIGTEDTSPIYCNNKKGTQGPSEGKKKTSR